MALNIPGTFFVEVVLTFVLMAVALTTTNLKVITKLSVNGYSLGSLIIAAVFVGLVITSIFVFLKSNASISAGHMNPLFTIVGMMIQKLSPGTNIFGVTTSHGGVLLAAQLVAAVLATVYAVFLLPVMTGVKPVRNLIPEEQPISPPPYMIVKVPETFAVPSFDSPWEDPRKQKSRNTL